MQNNIFEIKVKMQIPVQNESSFTFKRKLHNICFEIMPLFERKQTAKVKDQNQPYYALWR